MSFSRVLKSTFISGCLITCLVAICAFAQPPLAVAADTTTTHPAAEKFTAAKTSTTFAPGSNYTDEVTVKATDANGAALKDVVFDVFVSDGDARVYAADKSVGTNLGGLKTDTDGTKKFSIITGQSSKFKLRIVPHGADDAPQLAKIVDLSFETTATDTTVTHPVAEKFVATQTNTTYDFASNYPDEIIIKATDGSGAPVKDVAFEIFVSEGDARIFTSDKPVGTTLALKTDADGTKKISLITGKSSTFKLRVVPHGADDKPQLVKVVDMNFDIGPKFKDALSSDRAFVEFFMGQTFANNYDANGNNTGFGNAGPLIQLTFDTMWKRPRALWLAPCPPSQGSPAKTCEAPCVASSHGDPCEKPTPRMYHGLWHTELNMAFTKFPFGESKPTTPEPELGKRPRAESDTTPTPTAPLENAFTGTLGLIFQPDSWASYSNTSRDTDLRYDAVRWGVFARAGFTTRAQKSSSGDTAIGRGQLGLRFTHNHSAAKSGDLETVNYIPIRFVEVSYGWFEQFQGARTHEAHRRLVIDGGIRLVPLSNKIIPFYAGVHANVGKGPDDVRVFAGFLFKLDKLAELMAPPSTP